MANELTSYLAQNLQELRQKRGLSQLQLAKIAGIPRSSVTYMESGSGNPSLLNLSALAAGLQVSIEELLARPRPQVQLIKAEDVPTQSRSNGGTKIFKLLPDKIPGMEIDRLELSPGVRMGGIPHVANSKEYLYCVKGKVVVSVNHERYLLKEGDVLAFPGDQSHVYYNEGRITAVCLSVVTLAPLGI